MPRYKVLKSVAHNAGHSYLSLMNWRDGDYVVEHLFRRARETGVTVAHVDLLRGVVEPEAFRTPTLVASAARQAAWLASLAERGGADPGMIREARLTVAFDLAATRPSPTVPGLQLAAYACTVEIVDDRGRRHVASVPEWWRY